jgi:1-carboxybiuret hydrolase subunit AtzG-like protein
MTPKDPLDAFITAAAETLALPIDPAWRPAVRAHLEVTLRLARLVDEIELPDDAEPAPIFRA